MYPPPKSSDIRIVSGLCGIDLNSSSVILAMETKEISRNHSVKEFNGVPFVIFSQASSNAGDGSPRYCDGKSIVPLKRTS